MPNESQSRDLVLAPGEYAYVLDTTKGQVATLVGSTKVSMSNTDQPVIWDKTTKRFKRVDQLERAIQTNTIAPEGFYVALYNPSAIGNATMEHPRESSSSTSVSLSVGHRVNIPGPANFPLWPGQMAEVIRGHHLRSNQYLLAQVYNDVEATKNWQKAVLKPQEITQSSPATEDGEAPPPENAEDAAKTKSAELAKLIAEPRSFTPGQLIIIKGTEVAFFIPPTGIKVVPEIPNVYVREAVTLERLEYCILLDEDGNKRFVRGPDVVFPEPTEHFVEKADDDGNLARKFKAIELNESSGIYVKVIKPYDENGRHYKEGDELFITGTEQAIYFQREEHAVIRYGDQTKHYGVALPAGEGRYVLDRQGGGVSIVRGPKMFLPNPITQLIIRRILSEKTAALWYPNNQMVIQVNKDLAAQNKRDDPSQYVVSSASNMPMASSGAYASTMSLSDISATRTSRQIAGDIVKRGTAFTPPRTIVLDTKYDGAVSISVWTGYAVLVINKTGGRKVVVGPETFLLEYDETLARLALSTGTPKTDKALFETVYLRVQNNQISDEIKVETMDLVNLTIKVGYRVNFEGEDPEKWFAVENYVKLLCDHIRSLVRNTVKRRGVEEFYASAADIIRDAILGALPTDGHARSGKIFSENGMRVYDVEVLAVTINDMEVAKQLHDLHADAIGTAIRLSKQERLLAFTERAEEINQEIARAKTETMIMAQGFTANELKAKTLVELQRVTSEADLTSSRLNREVEEIPARLSIMNSELERQQAADAQRLTTTGAEDQLAHARMTAQSDEIVKRAAAVSPALVTALTNFSERALIEKAATALAPMAAMQGMSPIDILQGLLKGTQLGNVLKELSVRTQSPAISGNGQTE